MGDRCEDNRFEIIKKAKAELLKSTNIETSEDEMKVLDNFLFRCGQMGWLERYDKPRLPLDIPTMTTDFVKDHGFPCPKGYIFKDENGNVINAQKIVLERKEYPKTFRECQRYLGEDVPPMEEPVSKTHRRRQVHLLEVLLICRDAYWKIAGEEMGLGKAWKPSWDKCTGDKYCIFSVLNTLRHDTVSNSEYHNRILAFPTEAMRDAFYENFKEFIEECKELL